VNPTNHFQALGLMWRDTGRIIPPLATLAIQQVHPKWDDLCWHDPVRDVWVYISTRIKQTL